MKKYAKVVFVDTKEQKDLPQDIRQKLMTSGGSMPLLLFLSPDGETSFGVYNHSTLKNQKYSTIFRDLKKKIKEAQDEGQLKDSGLVAKTDDAKTDDAHSAVVVISGPRVRTWKSAKGSEIQAMLIKFEKDTFHLKTTKGKIIKVTAKDLEAKSVEMAEEIVRLNKG